MGAVVAMLYAGKKPKAAWCLFNIGFFVGRWAVCWAARIKPLHVFHKMRNYVDNGH